MLVSYQRHQLSSSYIPNLHAKPYQKLLTYPKIWSAFPKTESYRKIRKFRALQTKVLYQLTAACQLHFILTKKRHANFAKIDETHCLKDVISETHSSPRSHVEIFCEKKTICEVPLDSCYISWVASFFREYLSLESMNMNESISLKY